MNEKTKKSLTKAAMPVWIALHLYTSVHTFFESWYETYTGWTWLTLWLWFLGLLALDVWLCRAGSAESLRGLCCYWAFSAGFYAVLILSALLDAFPDWTLIPLVFCSFIAPVYQMNAFSGLLAGMAKIGKGGMVRVEGSAGLLCCLLHFAYMAWLYRRAKKRGETENGPVGPGAGAVE